MSDLWWNWIYNYKKHIQITILIIIIVKQLLFIITVIGLAASPSMSIQPTGWTVNVQMDVT